MQGVSEVTAMRNGSLQGGAAKAFCVAWVLWGISFGKASANPISLPIMTVRGASKILGWFFSDASPASFDLLSVLRTQTNRAGLLFAEVGPHFKRS
jgi:hypothetical protein